MNVAYEAFYLAQWLIYLVRLVLSLAYGVVQFVAKPGSRYIIPVATAVAGYYFSDQIERFLVLSIIGFNAYSLPGFAVELVRWMQDEFAHFHFRGEIQPWMMHVAIAVLGAIGCYIYVLVSRTIAVVVGAFPKVTRPLRPLRRLRATNLKIKSAVVQLAVPPLRF